MNKLAVWVQRVGFAVWQATFLLSLAAVFLLITDLGFDNSEEFRRGTLVIFRWFLLLGVISVALRYLAKGAMPAAQVWVFDGITVSMALVVLLMPWVSEEVHGWSAAGLRVTVLLSIIREVSEKKIQLRRSALNPAQLFVLSFLALVTIGALMLKLPNATISGISFLDAMFTSTSAVCVTGLIVVDTATFFTPLGKSIILVLIQIGGLGILTIASYFSQFFREGSSYENQLILRDLTNSQRIAEVFSTLRSILVITFAIELLGAALIFFSLEAGLFSSMTEKVFFSVFHSVSAFCNAGFSTFTNGLFEEPIRFNYSLQLVIIALLVFGGLGFPIVLNVLSYLKHLLYDRILRLGAKSQARPWVLNINSRITLITSLVLVVVGTLGFYASEYHATLADHGPWGKFVTALFGATTPRTAGFNTVDMASLRFPTVMLTMFLMWIGAAPASTGGGIKTSTFAVATLNFLSLARGKSRIEVFRRQISDLSVRRAFAVISLSLVVIGCSVFAISIFDEDKDLLSIGFECFSAYSTVGLSIGLTASLSAPSKAVLIATMFIGRVGMLTVMIALFRQARPENYRYPSEEIIIN